MATMKTYKVNALPSTLEANAVYYVKSGTDAYLQYITNSAGTVAHKATIDAALLTFNRYDLPTAASTTGVMNLALNQIFKIDASTAGATIPMSFTNIPASTRSMVVVVEVKGAARQVTLPAGTVVTDNVDNTLATVMSIMTFFYDGTTFYLMTNARVNA